MGDVRLDHQLAELTLQRIEAMEGDDRTAALTAKVRGAHRIPSFRGSELAEDLQVCPRRIHVDVVRVREQRGELRTRRTRGDLADGDVAGGPPKPLHVRETGAQPESAQAAQSIAADGIVFRA